MESVSEGVIMNAEYDGRFLSVDDKKKIIEAIRSGTIVPAPKLPEKSQA